MDEEARARAIQENFEEMAMWSTNNFSDLEKDIDEAQTEYDDEFEDEEDDPTQVTGSRFHAFYKEKHHHDVTWYAEGRWDELVAAGFTVRGYKVRLWRWDPTGVDPGDYDGGNLPVPGPGVTGYVKKYPVGHPKAGEYMPPRVKNIESMDKDTNTFVKTEWSDLLRNAKYVQDARAIGTHHKKGPWSVTSAVGTAADTTYEGPTPTAPTIDVDRNGIDVDWAYPVNPDNPNDRHPEIAYSKVKVTDDALGTTITTKPNGTLLFDGFVHGSKRHFDMHRVRGNHWPWVQFCDGSGNCSAWVVGASGNKHDPTTPASAPTLDFDQGGKDHVRAFGTGTVPTLTDKDVATVDVRLRITKPGGASEKKRWDHIPVSELDEGGSFEYLFLAIPEGAVCKVDFRITDEDGNHSGFSPVIQSTAYDVVGTEVPSVVDIRIKSGGIIGRWGITATMRFHISHFEVELWNNTTTRTGTLLDYDYMVKASRKRFDVDRSTNFGFWVRAISQGGTASSWVQIGAGFFGGISGNDLDDNIVEYRHFPNTGRYSHFRNYLQGTSYVTKDWFDDGTGSGRNRQMYDFMNGGYLTKDWFDNGSGSGRGRTIYNFLSGSGLGTLSDFTSDVGTVTAGIIEGPVIRTDSSGNNRIILGASGEEDRIAIEGDSGTRRANLYADSGKFIIETVNNSDLFLNVGGTGRLRIDTAALAGASGGLVGYLLVKINNTDRKIPVHST